MPLTILAEQGVTLKVRHEAQDLKAAMVARSAVVLQVPMSLSRTEPPNPDLEFGSAPSHKHTYMFTHMDLLACLFPMHVCARTLQRFKIGSR